VSEAAAAVGSIRNNGNRNVGAGINLRGLGAGSTLVLLDGRRIASGGSGAFVDVSTIPLSALERIEVITDGASAIYGSDAVGGVVNFILRDDYDGAETNIRYGGVTDGDLRELNVSQLAGATWDRGAVLLSLDYAQSDPLLASDRSYASSLATGLTYLSANAERMGALLDGHFDLHSSLRLSATAYLSSSDGVGEVFSPGQLRQFSHETTADRAGGTLALDWQFADSWKGSLAQTYSRNKTDRDSVFGPSATIPTSVMQFIDYAVEAATTEIDVGGALFEMPGGAARLAVGAEHREDRLRVGQAGVSARADGVTRFKRDVDAGYAEVLLPFISDRNARFGVRQLDLTAAIRYEDYSDVGSTTNFKTGLVWSPLEGAHARVSYGTSFRAPDLFQFDDSLSAGGYLNLPGPDGAMVPTVFITQAPHPDLGPENARTWSAGIDLDQSRLRFVSLSATYFFIDYEDRIGAVSPGFNALTDPSRSPLVSMPADPEIVAAVAALPSYTNLVGQPLSTAQATYDGRIRNLSGSEVSGIDLTLTTSHESTIGRFGGGVNASYLLGFKNRTTATAPLVDIADTIFNPAALRARAHLNWGNGGWSIAAFVNYTGDYVDNQLPAALRRVDSWTTFDLSAAHAFGEGHGLLSGLTVRVNALNVFDEAPPAIIDRTPAFGNPGYDTENANPFGRIVSLQFVKQW
jgi:outer membrane receptor protein involved in Fe transport